MNVETILFIVLELLNLRSGMRVTDVSSSAKNNTWGSEKL